ncbi:hypothetical protein [Jiella pacifica]|uniref:Uncharacterized protein n=1 Tax=Jiella pacifica TaxID=2696469 RepID=A0A6N9TBM8_9HYPH|nr:hypothetical protein [Jiella pacifica]NDW07476.1 hypothetical protein [Jiella pacifica]
MVRTPKSPSRSHRHFASRIRPEEQGGDRPAEFGPLDGSGSRRVDRRDRFDAEAFGPSAAPGTPGIDAVTAFVDTTAAELVDATIAAGESLDPDPMLRELSSLASMLRSVVGRVGTVIPDVIAGALRQDPALTVLREYPLPMTRSATELVRANRKDIVATLPHDQHVIATWMADLIVIDETTRHASIHEVKRGGSVFSGARCGDTIDRLRIVALTARRALDADGYDVASVSVSVIDRYGRAGHEKKMSVGPDELDDVFGIPCRAFLDRLDAAVRAALLVRIAPAIRDLAAKLAELGLISDVKDDGGADGQGGLAAEDDPEIIGRGPKAAGPSETPIDLSRFIGIAERRRQTEPRRMN